MYEALILIKPGIEVGAGEIERIAREASSPSVQVSRQPSMVVVESGSSRIEIAYNDDDYVLKESQELSDEYEIPCAECSARYELSGEDITDTLSTVYASFIEGIVATEKCFVFDQVGGRLLT